MHAFVFFFAKVFMDSSKYGPALSFMIAAGLLRLRGFWPRSVLSGRQALHEGTSDNDASGGKTLRACVRAT